MICVAGLRQLGIVCSLKELQNQVKSITRQNGSDTRSPSPFRCPVRIMAWSSVHTHQKAVAWVARNALISPAWTSVHLRSQECLPRFSIPPLLAIEVPSYLFVSVTSKSTSQQHHRRGEKKLHRVLRDVMVAIKYHLVMMLPDKIHQPVMLVLGGSQQGSPKSYAFATLHCPYSVSILRFVVVRCRCFIVGVTFIGH